MTEKQWVAFSSFREIFQSQVERWTSQFSNELIKLQKEAAAIAKTPPYPFETPIVYNKSLDEVSKTSELKLIVIGDNPGKDEQLQKNNRYLVGQAGKLADGFFKKNSELGIDFRSNVIILNKTPVHTAKTKQLLYIEKNASSELRSMLLESQLFMARITAELHQKLGCALYLVGYSELKGRGLFIPYRDELKKCYATSALSRAWASVFVYQHFSMNRFSIDLADFKKKMSHLQQSDSAQLSDASPLAITLKELGSLHRKEIFGD